MGQGHPGRPQQQRMLSPEEHMWNQWWQEQMMLNEMMRAPAARRRPAQQQPGTGGPQTGIGPSQPGASQRRAGVNERSILSQPRQKQRPQSPLPGAKQKPPSPESDKRAKQDASADKTRQHTRERSTLKNHAREADAVHKLPLAADRGTISLLRTVHSKLQRADADYQGHRVRAMDHVASALRHLGWSSPVSGMFAASSGNLPQGKSDQILRDAIVQLNITEKNLGTGTTGAEHHRNAHVAVAEAIRELHVALNIR